MRCETQAVKGDVIMNFYVEDKVLDVGVKILFATVEGVNNHKASEKWKEVRNHKIQERISVRRFINTSYDYCTGSHVGPGAIALFFMGKDRELDS